MADEAEFDPEALLQALSRADVRYVLVGGLAAVVQGAAIATFDVDIVHERSAENVQRLLDVLQSLDAHYRGRPAGQRIVPDSATLLGPGHQLLRTRHGPLDVLGAIEDGLDYEQLLNTAEAVELDDRRVQILKLEKLIALKSKSTHPKDRARLQVLLQTMNEKKGV